MIRLSAGTIRTRLLFLLLCLSITSGCAWLNTADRPAPVPEVRPGILYGYLPFEAACDSMVLLAPPPATGSAAFALDEAVMNQNLALRGTPRWKLAASDADLSFPHTANTYSCVMGIPVSEKDTPFLYMLLRRTFTDAIVATLKAKKHYQRIRPFVMHQAPTCSPDWEGELRKDGSYPSGHSAIGWTWALILSEIDPKNGDAILSRGMTFEESRLVCDVHWLSDVIAGRLMGAAVAARLHSSPAFLADLKAAQSEIAAVRAQGLKPTRNCLEEAAALSRKARPSP